MKKISVVIVSHNTAGLLDQCLQSVLTHAGVAEPEVFVVDNGSCDGSVEMVRRRYPNVNLIENRRNLGFARAANQALRQASGEAALLLNSDAQLLPGALPRMSQILEDRHRAGAVGAALVDEEGRLQNAVDHFPTLLTELCNKSLLKMIFPRAYPGKYSGFAEPVEVPALIGAAMLVRREVIETVGLLDESFFFFMEETDWCWRMRKAGWAVVHEPRARILHLGGATAKKFSWRSKVEYYRSRYLFFRKNRSRAATAALAAGLLLKISVGLVATGAATLLSAGRLTRLRARFVQYAGLLWWHARGCPPGMGLAPEGRES